MLSILLLSLLAVSAVSAAENATDDIVGVSDESEVISVEENQNSSLSQVAVNSEDSSDLKAPEGEVLKSSVNDTVEVLTASSASVKTDEVLGAVSPESSQTEPVLKAKKTKTVKMSVKYKWTTKKIGKFKLKARLWRVTYMGGYVNYLDIMLYKNGKLLKCGSYLSKYYYKNNGKWKWWSKWRHGGVNHSYHRYINNAPIKSIQVKFRY